MGHWVRAQEAAQEAADRAAAEAPAHAEAAADVERLGKELAAVSLQLTDAHDAAAAAPAAAAAAASSPGAADDAARLATATAAVKELTKVGRRRLTLSNPR